MGRKKKKSKQKIWCFYCDREFADEKVLTDHQKARHFKCPECYKRVMTMGGLTVHMTQVHKMAIEKCVATPGLRGCGELELPRPHAVTRARIHPRLTNCLRAFAGSPTPKRAVTTPRSTFMA